MNSGIYDCIIDPYDSKGNGDNQSLVDLVRFAELIVQECVIMADEFELDVLIILECAKIVATAFALREPASTYVSKILELRNEQTD
jgi:hypothetical protein